MKHDDDIILTEFATFLGEQNPTEVCDHGFRWGRTALIATQPQPKLKRISHFILG